MKQATAANDYLIEDAAKEKTMRNLLGEDMDSIPGQVDMMAMAELKTTSPKESDQS